jgi:hypothetical protein
MSWLPAVTCRVKESTERATEMMVWERTITNESARAALVFFGATHDVLPEPHLDALNDGKLVAEFESIHLTVIFRATETVMFKTNDADATYCVLMEPEPEALRAETLRILGAAN